MSDLFTKMIGKFLPVGRAWNLQPDSTLSKLLAALADEAQRVKDRMNELIVESDPRTTTELIEEWEGVLGLPGACIGLASTLEDRRAAVVAKLTSNVGQTKAYYVELVNSLGYSITESDITEPAAHTFSISLPLNVTRYFRVNAGTVGDRLTEFGDELLECVVDYYKPAHATVLYVYT